jgi:hypothetical protein
MNGTTARPRREFAGGFLRYRITNILHDDNMRRAMASVTGCEYGGIVL